MTRILKLLTILLAYLGSITIVQAEESVRLETRPNIVLLIADDQGYADLGCAGFIDDVSTPNLDRLANRGVRFTQAYATSPICNASRAGLITGAYQQRQEIRWYGGPGIHRVDIPTLAERLEAAGYRTGYVGKFHYGGGAAHRPESRSFPLNHGFATFFGFSGGRKHYLHHSEAFETQFQQAKRRSGQPGQSLAQGPLWDGRRQVDQDGYSTELFGARARAFLESDDDRPFFLTVAFNAVHNFTHQLPQRYLDKHGLAGYRDWNPEVEAYYDWYRQGRFPNNPEGRAHYLGQLHFLDIEVGRILDILEARDPADSTIVVYIGDNGGSTPIYAHNGPLRGSKYTLYEGGIRVPLIISQPGRYAEGTVQDNVVSALDLAPTLCSAAGVPRPEPCDGLDLEPLLTGDNPTIHHETLIWDTGHETAVRQGHWKLKTATLKRHADYEMVELELGTFLYDLRADPGERNDLAGDHPEQVGQLQAVFEAWRTAIALPAPTDR